jgi:hypothetical protein
MDTPEGRAVTDEEKDKARARLRDTIEQMRAAFADVPEDELQREIDKATTAAREETRRLLKKSKTA